MNDQKLKKDAGKLPLELLDFEALEGMARVLAFGAGKYKPHGWRAGMKWSRLLGAALRHLFAVARGEDMDQESGLPHIDHLACCVMFLSAYQKGQLGEDDRLKSAPVNVAAAPDYSLVTPPATVRDRYREGYDAHGMPVVNVSEISCMSYRDGRQCHLTPTQHRFDPLHSDGHAVWWSREDF